MQDPRTALTLVSSQRSLSLFRIGLFGVVFGELSGLYAQLPHAFSEPLLATLVVPLGLVASLCALLGLFARASALATWACIKLLQPSILTWYEVDWVMELFTGLFCFAPASQAWSLDALRRGRRGLAPTTQRVPHAFVVSTATIVALMYVDAVRTKLHSDIWLGGSALWLASFIPHVTRIALPPALQIEWILWTLTHLVTLYEASFLLVLTRLRPVIVALGLSLHLGIAVLLPLKYFGLIMASALALFVDVRAGTDPASVASTAAPPRRTAMAYGTYAHLALVCAAWLHMSVTGDRSPVARVLGVHPTGVYSDGMFAIPAPIYRLRLRQDGNETGLPSFDEHGYSQISDRQWKTFGFFTRFKPCPMNRLLLHIEGFRSACRARECEVSVLAKDVRLRTLDFDPSILEALRARPWFSVGTLHWRRQPDGSLASSWSDPAPGPGLRVRDVFLPHCTALPPGP